jgi:ABC-type transporter Mla MlaB component
MTIDIKHVVGMLEGEILSPILPYRAVVDVPAAIHQDILSTDLQLDMALVDMAVGALLSSFQADTVEKQVTVVRIPAAPHQVKALMQVVIEPNGRSPLFSE